MPESVKVPMPTWPTIKMVEECFGPVRDLVFSPVGTDQEAPRPWEEEPEKWRADLVALSASGVQKMEAWADASRESPNAAVWAIFETARVALVSTLGILSSKRRPLTGATAGQIWNWLWHLINLANESILGTVDDLRTEEKEWAADVLGKFGKSAPSRGEEVSDA